MVRCHIKFANSEFGSLFGSINYDNQAGIEQAYLVTEEIKIDFLQFITPVLIPMATFRDLWKEAPHEQSLTKETSSTYPTPYSVTFLRSCVNTNTSYTAR